MPQKGFSSIILLVIALGILAAISGRFLVLQEKKVPTAQESTPPSIPHVVESIPPEAPSPVIKESPPAAPSLQPPTQEPSIIEKSLPREQPEPQPSTQQNPSTAVTTDQCGNEIGNGAHIVSGPLGPEGPDRDNPFRSLTIHPTNPNSIIVGTERNGFVKSEDGGKTWSRFRYGLRHGYEGYPEIYDIAIAATNPNIIYAATTLGGPGPLMGDYPSSGGGIYKSTDGGKTWARKNCGIQNNGGRTISVHVDPNNESRAIIGVAAGTTSWFLKDIQKGQFFPGGIYITTNGGENWVKAHIAQNDEKNEYRYIRSAKLNPSLLYTFGAADDPNLNVGFLKSVDGGNSWQLFAPQLKNYTISHFDISSNGDTLYAIHDTKNGSAIWKSTDGGNNWNSYNLSTSGYTINISPSDANRILFGKVDGLYLSHDGLQSEVKVISISEDQRISDVQFAPSDSNIVYAITQGGYILYGSTDGGRTFTKIKDIRNEILNAIP